MSGIELIAAERKRQMEKEGWTEKHDDQHCAGELALAAICYAAPTQVRMRCEVPINCGCREADCPHAHITKSAWIDPWPWASEWDKRRQHSHLRRLEIAGALIAAEIDRILRAKQGGKRG